MKKSLNTILNLLKKYFLVCKSSLLFLVSFLSLILKNYIKFQIRLLHLVITNYVVYFIYLILLMHTLFNHKELNALGLSDLISFLIVVYIMGISFMVQFIYKISKLKNLFITFLGNEFTSFYLPNDLNHFLKCVAPIGAFVFLEVSSEQLSYHWQIHLQETCMDNYKLLYGFEPSEWTDDVKSAFSEERSKIKHSYGGVMTYLSGKISF